MTLLLEKLNLMITTRCDARCHYCIVRDTGEDMSRRLVDRSVDLLFRLGMPGRKLAFYGGEPLNRFDLIRAAADRVADQRAQTGDDMGLYIYTNGKALSGDRIRFIYDHDIKTIFSLDGARLVEGPLEEALKPPTLTALQSAVGPLAICGAAVILPQEASRLPRVVHYYVEALGFRVVKILPGLVRYQWTTAALKTLRTALDDTLKYVLAQAREGRFVFVDAVNESLHRRDIRIGPDDRHLSVMEIYPDGRMGLPTCEFTPDSRITHINDIHRYDLGSAWGTVTGDTLIRAWSSVKGSRNPALVLLGTWSDRVAAELTRLASQSRLIREYVARARELSFV